MFSLTYLSRATVPLDQAQLLEVLRVSRQRNAERGVTGLLLYADEQFIQTLEGAEADVDATMTRILSDTRHRDVDVTLTEDIASRRFPDWTMGFALLSGLSADDKRAHSDFLEVDSITFEHTQRLGRAGVFHRAFREIRPQPTMD